MRCEGCGQRDRAHCRGCGVCNPADESQHETSCPTLARRIERDRREAARFERRMRDQGWR